MTINFELWKVSKMTSLKRAINTKFRQQVNLIQRVLLNTLPQVVLVLLPPNHITLTIVFISSHRYYCYQIPAVKTTPRLKSIGHFSIGGTNVNTFWSSDIDKSLYPQLWKGHRGYVHPCKCLSCHPLFVSNILW